MSDAVEASAPDIAYLAGFSDAWATVRYLTVRLYVAYAALVILSAILFAICIRKGLTWTS